MTESMAESRVDRRLRFLREGINANFTVVCKDRTWKVESGVLSAESEYFEKLCTGHFSEASEKNASFPEEDPEVIDQVLVYLYTGVFDDLAVIEPDALQLAMSSDIVKDEENQDQVDEAPDVPPETTADDELADAAERLEMMEQGWECGSYQAESRSLKSASRDTITHILEGTILVYKCAKMMNVVELQHLAFHQLMAKEQLFIRSHLAEVLETLYCSTEVDDGRLRLEVTARCIANHDIIAEVPDGTRIQEVLALNEGSCWTVGVRLMKARTQAEIALRVEMATHKLTEESLESYKSQLKNSQDEASGLYTDLEDVKFEWDNVLPQKCACGREVSSGRFIKARDRDNRLQYMCKCNQKYSCNRYR